MEGFTVFIVWVLLCWGVAALASSRGRSGFGFFLLSFFFSPLLGLIVVLVIKNLTVEAERESEKRREDDWREQERKREHEKQLESLRVLAAKVPASADMNTVFLGSLADELQKLASLRDKGVLTSDEFERQKQTLLNRGITV